MLEGESRSVIRLLTAIVRHYTCDVCNGGSIKACHERPCEIAKALAKAKKLDEALTQAMKKKEV